MRQRLLMVLAVLVFAEPAGAQSDGLAAEPWRELGQGLSFRPPAGAKIVQNTADGALAKFLFEPDATLSVYIREASGPMDLAEVSDDAHRQFQMAKPSSVQVANEHPPMQVAGRESDRLTYLVAEPGGGQWIFSQVIVPIDTQHFIVFQLEGDAAQFQTLDPLFRRVVQSAELAPAEELQSQRQTLLDAGDQWLKHVREAGLVQKVAPERWFRIVSSNRDAGYQRLAAAPGSEMGDPGTKVSMQSRLIQPTAHVDTEAEYFVSNDLKHEIWSVRTAQRDARMSPVGPPAVLNQWSETGVRSPMRLGSDSWGLLQVTQARPEATRRYQWGAPPGVYVSQAEVQVLPLVLDGRPDELMYYAYHAPSATLNLRHETLTRLASGAKVLRIRPTPASGLQTLTFDPDGNLMRWELADGSVLLPATLEQVRRIYRN